MAHSIKRALCTVLLSSGCALLSAATSTAPSQQVNWPQGGDGSTMVAPGTVEAPPEARDTETLAKHAKNQPLMPGRERVDYKLSPAIPGEPLVLMTISGGGSRSAYYAARVMEQLSQLPAPSRVNHYTSDGWSSGSRSMLDMVRAISTVSAGGLAAGYYLTHYDERFNPEFYANFREAMAVNLQWRTYGHMIMFPPLAVQLLASSVTRTDLLADEIEKLMGGKQLTFDHLRVQETRANDPSPVLLVNGTVYNSGQRLVMTNLPGSRFPSLLEQGGSRIAISETDTRILYNLVQPLTFEDIGSDVGQFRLAQAIAASAAYPLLLAPVPLRVYPQQIPFSSLGRVDNHLTQSEVAYIADGGLYENEGVDPVLSLMKTVPRNQPVLLLVVDASQRMETMALRSGKVWGPTSVITRMYDIGSMRPLAFYNSLVTDFHDADKLETVFIRMEGYDDEMEKTLKNIPTAFKLSDEHRAALDAAATANVQRMALPLMEAYQRLSAPVRRAMAKQGSSSRAKKQLADEPVKAKAKSGASKTEAAVRSTEAAETKPAAKPPTQILMMQ